MSKGNGRVDYQALKDHFKGTGVNSLDILKAEKITHTLFYSGEKKPHMWRDEFEKQLNNAFLAYDKKEDRTVFSNNMKLRILTEKINAEFLQVTKGMINIELIRTPVTITYDQALTASRNQVNQKSPPEVSSSNSRARRINQVGTHGRGRG